MNEAKFNLEVVNSLKAAGAWAYKIPDIPVSQTYGMQFTPKKPCDILGIFGTRGFAIESKQIKDFKAFGPSALRPSQKQNLNEIVDQCRYSAFVFLNIRALQRSQYGYQNRLLIFEWNKFRKSENYKKNELLNLPYISGKKGIFDLWPFLAML